VRHGTPADATPPALRGPCTPRQRSGALRPAAVHGRSRTLDDPLALDRFLAGVERRALYQARIATGSTEEALDLVQDAMLALVRAYRRRDAAEWGPLFHRILHSRIRDWHRRRVVRERVRGWFGRRGGGRNDDGDNAADWIEAVPDPAPGPDGIVAGARTAAALAQALRALPLRQQQAFLLRTWEGLDVRQTARAMGCSEGSVKTHLSRATAALRERLGEHWS